MAVDTHGINALRGLAGHLVESYRELEILKRLDQHPLPNSQAVVEIVQDLKEIIAPGYQQRKNLRGPNLPKQLGELIDSLHARLTEQIARALKHQGFDSSESLAGIQNDVYTESREKAAAFLGSLPRIRRLIATDVQAAFDGDPAARSADEIIICYPGFEAISVYRFAHELFTLRVPLIPRMMTEWAHGRTGIDVHPGARIGPGFFIDHGTGVVIGETCEIADHVKLYQGVTLGALSFQQDADGNLVRGTKRHPTIERKVVIYANATVLGGATVIGANSVIGAGVSITKRVPPNTTVTVEKPSLRFREAS